MLWPYDVTRHDSFWLEDTATNLLQPLSKNRQKCAYQLLTLQTDI